MIRATRYEIATGRILGKMIRPTAADCDARCGEGEAWIGGRYDYRTHYIADPAGTQTLAERPTFPDPVEAPAGTWTWAGCPAGTEVEVWDTELRSLIATVPETGGAIEVTLPDPGAYLLRVEAWPHITQITEVTIT